jgi:hypothetical protein
MVDHRLTTLTRLSTSIDGAGHLTADHRAALVAIVDRTHDDLTATRTRIDGETTVGALEDDVKAVVQDERVYRLVAPQVRLTRGSDAGMAAAAKLDATAKKLQARIDYQEAAGKDVQAAQAALDDMRHQLSLATAQVGPLAGRVLPLLPADWNGGMARPILDAARSSLKAGRDELLAARRDARACRTDLR